MTSLNMNEIKCNGLYQVIFYAQAVQTWYQ